MYELVDETGQSGKEDEIGERKQWLCPWGESWATGGLFLIHHPTLPSLGWRPAESGNNPEAVVRGSGPREDALGSWTD